MWSVLVACLVASAFASPEETPNYSGSQVLEIADIRGGLVDEIIKNEHLDIWNRNSTHLEVLVPGRILSPFKRALLRSGLQFQTMIQDVQTAIEEENPPAPVNNRRNNRAGYRMTWQNFHRLDVIYEFIETLAKQYPKFVSVGTFGNTVENRPMKYIKIASGKPNAKKVFVDGGIHAREWAAPASVTYIIRELVENRKSLPKELLDLDFYIVPVVNPDGYEYTHTRDRMWRKNRSLQGSCYGVDLNRNFEYKWGGKGTSANSCNESFRGRSPASEPETRNLMNFLTSIRDNLKAFVTFHSYGHMVLIPYGDDYNAYAPGYNFMKETGDKGAAAIRKIGGPSYVVGNIANTIYPAAGGSVDWAVARLGVPLGFGVELRDGGQYGFLLPARFIIPTAKDAFEFVKVVASAASRS